MIHKVTIRAFGAGNDFAQWHSAITHSMGTLPGSRELVMENRTCGGSSRFDGSLTMRTQERVEQMDLPTLCGRGIGSRFRTLEIVPIGY